MRRTDFAALVMRLIDDAKAWAAAELAYAKAVAGERLRIARSGAVLLVAALVLLHGALIALFVGAVLSLATLVGPGWATLIVVGVSAVVAAILAKMAANRFATAKATKREPAEP